MYGINIDSPRTIETCLSLGLNPNNFRKKYKIIKILKLII